MGSKQKVTKLRVKINSIYKPEQKLSAERQNNKTQNTAVKTSDKTELKT
jgi:hypothetical protein